MKILILIAFAILIIVNNSFSQSECRKCEEERAKLIKENKELKDKPQTAPRSANCDEYKSEIKSLKGDIRDLKSKNETLNYSINNYQKDIENCNIKKSDLQIQISKYSDDIEKAQIDVRKLNDSIDVLNFRLIDLEKLTPDEAFKKKKSKLDKEIDNLQQIISQKNRAIDSLDRIIRSRKDEINNLSRDIDNKQDSIKDLNSDIEKFKPQKIILENEVENLIDDKNNKNDELSSIQNIINDQNRKLNSVNDDISNRNSYLRNLETTISNTEVRLDNLEKQLPAHFIIGIGLSCNWNFGAIDEKYVEFNINSWSGRGLIGYNFDLPRKDWNSREYANAFAVFVNYGGVSKNNIKTFLAEQSIDTTGFNYEHLNQFQEIELGLILSESLQLSGGLGTQDYEILKNGNKELKKLEYISLSLGLQAPFSEYWDMGILSTVQFGLDYNKTAIRFGLYTTVKLNFLKW